MSRFSTQAPIGAAIAALGVFAITTNDAPKLVILNESPSLPRGLYVRAMNQAEVRGAIVAVTQPIAARTYLAGLRMPDDVPLLKRVAATTGDAVCASADAVTLPDRTLRVRGHDRLGTSLPVWRGCRRLAADEVFVVGDTANSFDSRYFGPIPRTNVEGVFQELVTW